MFWFIILRKASGREKAM